LEDFVDEIRHIASDETDVKIFVFTADEERNRIVGMMSKACDIVFTDPQMAQDSDRFIAFDYQRRPLWMNNAKAEMFLEGVKIMVMVEECMSLNHTKSSDKAIDSLPNRTTM
jgi:hypothetical protein